MPDATPRDPDPNLYRSDIEPYRPQTATSAAPSGPRRVLQAAVRGSALVWFVVCLSVVSDAWVQLPLTGTIDVQQLGWTALVSLSGMLAVYGLIVGELWAVGSVVTALLAMVGRLTGGFPVGILIGLLILSVAALRQRNAGDLRGGAVLIGVGIATSVLLSLFVFLDWLSSVH